MTTDFWFAIAALVGLCLVFVLVPLFFYRPPEKDVGDESRDQNLEAYQTRQAELDEEHRAGLIDDQTWRQMTDELKASLLDDVGTGGRKASGGASLYSRKPLVWVSLVGLILIPLLSVSLYQDRGALAELRQYQTMKEMATDDGNRAERMAELAGQLRQRLEEEPDNPRGWAMLGRTYMTLEDYKEAAWAFRKLASQVTAGTEREATAWGLAAQAEYFLSQGRLTDSVRTAIENARKRNPDEVNALGVLGVHAFSEERFREALTYWERILEVAPDHPRSETIRRGVAAAYARLGEPVPERLQTGGESDGETRLTVRVSLSDEIRGEVPNDAALFVFAREVGGAPVPLAAAKLKAGDLPTTLRLDDSMAMNPSQTLSSAERVMVTARVSLDGSVQASGGGWQGSLANVLPLSDYQGETLEISVDQPLEGAGG